MDGWEAFLFRFVTLAGNHTPLVVPAKDPFLLLPQGVVAYRGGMDSFIFRRRARRT